MIDHNESSFYKISLPGRRTHDEVRGCWVIRFMACVIPVVFTAAHAQLMLRGAVAVWTGQQSPGLITGVCAPQRLQTCETRVCVFPYILQSMVFPPFKILLACIVSGLQIETPTNRIEEKKKLFFLFPSPWANIQTGALAVAVDYTEKI